MLSLVQLYIINSQYLELSVGVFWMQLQSSVLVLLCGVREGSELGALLVIIFWGRNAVNETSSGKLLTFYIICLIYQRSHVTKEKFSRNH